MTSFLIKAAYRLKAAEENQKEVRDLSDSSLRRIADDNEDERSHQAERELEKRQEQNQDKNDQSDASNKSDDNHAHNVYESQNLLHDPKEKPSKKQKPIKFKKQRRPLLDEQQVTEVGEIGKEVWKYAL